MMPRLKKVTRDTVEEMITEGYTTGEIHEKTGVSANTIRKLRRENDPRGDTAPIPIPQIPQTPQIPSEPAPNTNKINTNNQPNTNQISTTKTQETDNNDIPIAQTLSYRGEYTAEDAQRAQRAQNAPNAQIPQAPQAQDANTPRRKPARNAQRQRERSPPPRLTRRPIIEMVAEDEDEYEEDPDMAINMGNETEENENEEGDEADGGIDEGMFVTQEERTLDDILKSLKITKGQKNAIRRGFSSNAYLGWSGLYNLVTQVGLKKEMAQYVANMVYPPTVPGQTPWGIQPGAPGTPGTPGIPTAPGTGASPGTPGTQYPQYGQYPYPAYYPQYPQYQYPYPAYYPQPAQPWQNQKQKTPTEQLTELVQQRMLWNQLSELDQRSRPPDNKTNMITRKYPMVSDDGKPVRDENNQIIWMEETEPYVQEGDYGQRLDQLRKDIQDNKLENILKQTIGQNKQGDIVQTITALAPLLRQGDNDSKELRNTVMNLLGTQISDLRSELREARTTTEKRSVSQQLEEMKTAFGLMKDFSKELGPKEKEKGLSEVAVEIADKMGPLFQGLGQGVATYAANVGQKNNPNNPNNPRQGKTMPNQNTNPGNPGNPGTGNPGNPGNPGDDLKVMCQCGKPFLVGADALGAQVMCPHCKNVMTVVTEEMRQEYERQRREQEALNGVVRDAAGGELPQEPGNPHNQPDPWGGLTPNREIGYRISGTGGRVPKQPLPDQAARTGGIDAPKPRQDKEEQEQDQAAKRTRTDKQPTPDQYRYNQETGAEGRYNG